MHRTIAIVIILMFIMSVMYWISASPSHGALSDSACSTCHFDDVGAAQTQLYIHAPFRDGKCGVCHVANYGENSTDTRAESLQSSEIASDSTEPKGIMSVDVRWLYEYFEPVQNLLLPLNAAEVERMLVVELWDKCRVEHQHVVPVPPLHQARPLPPQSRGEVQIHTLNIARDPHRSDTVVVQCRTNVPVRGELILHEKGGGMRSLPSPQGYHSRMEMRIHGLRSNARYELEFAYASVDGVHKRSPMHVFVPAQLSPVKRPDSAVGDRLCELEAEVEVYQGECEAGSCYFLKVAASQPVTLSVGALKPGVDVPSHLGGAALSSSPTAAVQSTTTQENESGFHSDLAGRYFTNYESCRPCHANSFGPMSHPVDVVPRAGMEVSPELPLLDDGRISCMTCHVFHTGNDKYRLRFASRQELCHACHSEY